MGAFDEGDAVGDGILFAAAPDHRLCEERDAESESSGWLPDEYLVRRQPEWAELCGSGDEFHMDSEEIADSADRVDGFARRANRAAWT